MINILVSVYWGAEVWRERDHLRKVIDYDLDFDLLNILHQPKWFHFKIEDEMPIGKVMNRVDKQRRGSKLGHHTTTAIHYF